MCKIPEIWSNITEKECSRRQNPPPRDADRTIAYMIKPAERGHTNRQWRTRAQPRAKNLHPSTLQDNKPWPSHFVAKKDGLIQLIRHN